MPCTDPGEMGPVLREHRFNGFFPSLLGVDDRVVSNTIAMQNAAGLRTSN